MPTSGPAPAAVPGLRRNMVTICAMTATIMQALDTTIANVALPYMQGTLSASQDQINWVLTSYIVAAAIMTAPVGWIANRFGRKRIFIICSGGFTIASVMCGLAQDINQMVLFRLLQGVFGAALVPLSQAVMLDTYALHERAKAMAIWGMGVMMGPIMGPSLGAWLTETYSWHWVFFVNLPFGIFTVLGLVIFMDETKKDLALRFDWFGFTALAVAIGSLQLALDRGEQLGWLESNEIIAEFIISVVGFYYFFAHSFTTSKPFIQFALFKDKNFVGGCVFMAVMGMVLFSTMALSSPFMQNVIGYPIITAGVMLATRGCGTFVAMMLVGRLMRYIEARNLIISGLSITALSLFYMTGWTDQTGGTEIVVISVLQGFGFGLVFVPLSTVAFLTLPNHLRTDGTSMLTLMRNVASSVGISLVISQLTEGSRRVYANLSEHINPFNHAMQMPNVRGMIDMIDRHRPRHGGCHGQDPGADHRLLARLPAGDAVHPGRDPADDHDRLDQGSTTGAIGRARPCGDRVVIAPRLAQPHAIAARVLGLLSRTALCEQRPEIVADQIGRGGAGRRDRGVTEEAVVQCRELAINHAHARSLQGGVIVHVLLVEEVVRADAHDRRCEALEIGENRRCADIVEFRFDVAAAEVWLADIRIAVLAHVERAIEQHLRGELDTGIAALDGRHGREIAAGAVAADRQRFARAAQPAKVGVRPFGAGDGILDALRERILRRQPVIDVDDDNARAIGKPDRMGLVAVDIAEDVTAAVEIDQRADRRAFDRLHDLDGDRPVRTRDAGPFELARRQLRLGIEKRANIARPLAADRAVASRV